MYKEIIPLIYIIVIVCLTNSIHSGHSCLSHFKSYILYLKFLSYLFCFIFRHAAEERFWKLKIHEDGSYVRYKGFQKVR
jgi:hypothetical protein